MSKLQSIVKGNNLRCGRPNLVKVDNRGERDSRPWLEALKKNLSPDRREKIIILLLPGRKGDERIYKPIKKFLNTNIGVPSQVVLNSTLERGKNMMSIVSKIVLQIAAKLNNRPWIIDSLPLMKKPTMICGLDISTVDNDINMCFVYTTDSRGARPTHSFQRIRHDCDDFEDKMKTAMTEAVDNFTAINKVTPHRVIVYRDGLGKGDFRCRKEVEVDNFHKACSDKGVERFHYIIVNKKVSTKMFVENSRGASNPQPGTIISEEITERKVYETPSGKFETREFYLVSQPTRIGTPVPSKYIIMQNLGNEEGKDQVEAEI